MHLLMWEHTHTHTYRKYNIPAASLSLRAAISARVSFDGGATFPAFIADVSASSKAAASFLRCKASRRFFSRSS